MKMWLVVSVSPSTGRPMGCPGLAIEFGEPCLFKTVEEANYITDELYPDEQMFKYELTVGKVDKKLLNPHKRKNRVRT